MIDPLNRADYILDYSSELAEALFDVIVFVADSEDPKNNPQVDRLMERVWARTDAAQKWRQNSREKRSAQLHDNTESETDSEPLHAVMQV